MSARIERYDPAQHDPGEYLGVPRSNYDEYDRRAHLMLNSVFTDLAAHLERDVREAQYIAPPADETGFPVEKKGPDPLPSARKFCTVDGQHFLRAKGVVEWRSPLSRESMTIMVPIGAYGKDWAYSLGKTAGACYGLIHKVLHDRCRDVTQAYRDVLVRHTFQNNAERTMFEGIQTIAGTLALLTARPITGYEDRPFEFSAAIVTSGVLDRIALSMPVGYIFPMARNGCFFPSPIEQSAGGLTLTDAFVAYMRFHREFPEGGFNPHQGCPAARKNTPIGILGGEAEIVGPSAITLLSNVFMRYLPHYVGQRT